MTALALPQLAGGDLLTHSRMSCAKTCLRKHFYQYELGVRRARESQPLRLGAAFHVGLDERAKGKSEDDAILAAVVGYDEIPAWCNTPELLEDWILERETVGRLLSGYFWRWGGDQFEIVATELAFELPIRNPETGGVTSSFKVAGKIDKIIRLPDGRLAVMEHKTTGDSLDADGDYWRRLRLDQQISLYYCAARQLGFDVQTVLYDVVRKPSIRPKKVVKADAGPNYYGEELHAVAGEVETPRMFGARLTADIAERPDFYYARQEIPRLKSDLTEFLGELWDMQQTLRACQKHERWYRNTSACIHPYRCEYLDVCHNGIDLSAGLPQGYVRIENVNPELE